MSKDQQYLEILLSHAIGTVRFFSAAMKPERERSAIAALLRCLGIAFCPDELVCPNNDPPDIIFREARFELVEVLEESRRRHAEWKSKVEQLKSIRSFTDLMTPYRRPAPLTYKQIGELASKALLGKSQKYGASAGCSHLDAVVYMDHNSYLDSSSAWFGGDELKGQGWRSVSILIPMHAIVLFTGPEAPVFLQLQAGKTRREWNTPDGLFDL